MVRAWRPPSQTSEKGVHYVGSRGAQCTQRSAVRCTLMVKVFEFWVPPAQEKQYHSMLEARHARGCGCRFFGACWLPISFSAGRGWPKRAKRARGAQGAARGFGLSYPMLIFFHGEAFWKGFRRPYERHNKRLFIILILLLLLLIIVIYLGSPPSSMIFASLRKTLRATPRTWWARRPRLGKTSGRLPMANRSGLLGFRVFPEGGPEAHGQRGCQDSNASAAPWTHYRSLPF